VHGALQLLAITKDACGSTREPRRTSISTLFEHTVIHNLVLANRFVRSAKWEGMAAPDGKSTTRLADKMVKLAEGGVGLIITGHAYVSREGQAGPWQLGVNDDTTIPGLAQMTEAVHGSGGKIALQIAHGGAHAKFALSGLDAIGPSVLHKDGAAVCREMTHDDINRVVRAFGDAAGRAKRVGFDAVQIHAAHGYLLNRFLSPWVNQRTDVYGGSLSNRARVVLKVVAAVRQAVGNDYPVMIKLNSEDFIEGGFSVEDMLAVSAPLEVAGIDAIELSGGTINDLSRFHAARFGATSKDDEAYYRDAARRFKQRIGVPLILVGGIRSLDVAERLVAEGVTDHVALCRPLICEPDLVNRWKSGDTRKSRCVSDNRCFGPAVAGKGLRCVLGEKVPRAEVAAAK
jgi:2,4-dienoyl-CoA reductase-like NADH-dependent reductase (Old Yellow Enzyme family)